MGPNDIKDLILYSEKATDKIVAVYTGSFNSNTAPTLGGFLPYTTINHGFTRPVFVKAQFSKDNATWSDMNSRSPFDGSSTNGIAYSTASQVFILVDGAQGTVYYRILAFWIDNFDASNPLVPPTTGTQSQVYFDSRLNAQKIFKQGVQTLNGVNGTATITHNLGYEPNVRVYNEMLPNQVWPANFGGVKNPWVYNIDMTECEVQITSTDVKIFFGGSVSSPPARFWYIIYYDA